MTAELDFVKAFWPQIIVLGLLAFALLVSAHLHGKPRAGKHDFWSGFIVVIIQLWLLLAGGFFSGML